MNLVEILKLPVIKKRHISDKTTYLCSNLNMYTVLIISDENVLIDSRCFFTRIEALHYFNQVKGSKGNDI